MVDTNHDSRQVNFVAFSSCPTFHAHFLPSSLWLCVKFLFHFFSSRFTAYLPNGFSQTFNKPIFWPFLFLIVLPRYLLSAVGISFFFLCIVFVVLIIGLFKARTSSFPVVRGLCGLISYNGAREKEFGWLFQLDRNQNNSDSENEWKIKCGFDASSLVKESVR